MNIFDIINFVLNERSGCSADGSALALGERVKTVNERFDEGKCTKQGVEGAVNRNAQRLCDCTGRTKQLYREFTGKKIKQSGCSADGSALALGARCRRFESCHSDQELSHTIAVWLGLFLCDILRRDKGAKPKMSQVRILTCPFVCR